MKDLSDEIRKTEALVRYCNANATLVHFNSKMDFDAKMQILSNQKEIMKALNDAGNKEKRP